MSKGKTIDPQMTDEAVREFIHDSYSLKPANLFLKELTWKHAVRAVLRGKNVMFVGRAGCAKTMTAYALQQAMGRPAFYFNLGATQDPRATLIGNTQFNKEKGTYFSEALFVKAIQTPGAVILLDELTRAHPEAWNILMTPLDLNQRYLRLDEEDGSPTIKVAEGVSFIATANIGSEYTSTRVLDRAIKDRFTIVEIPELGDEDEYNLLKNLYPSVEEAHLRALASIADATRKDMRSDTPKLSDALSTRASVEAASLLFDNFTLSEVCELVVYPFFDKDGGLESERTFVKQICQKYIDTKKDENTGEELPDTDILFDEKDMEAASK